jgi:hypothetical protein
MSAEPERGQFCPGADLHPGHQGFDEKQAHTSTSC